MPRFVFIDGVPVEVISEKDLADEKRWSETRQKRLKFLFDIDPNHPDGQRIWIRCCWKVSFFNNNALRAERGEIKVIKES